MSNSAYSKLVQVYTRLHRFSHATSILSWDFSVNVAPKGAESRGACLAELKVLTHGIETNPELGALLEEASKDVSTMTPEQAANLHEIRRSYDMCNALPVDLVERISLATSRCEHAWRTQRSSNDWSGFLPNFKEVVNLSREEAHLLQRKHGFPTPYDALLDKYEPGTTTTMINAAFNDLKSWLPGLIKRVVSLQNSRGPMLRPQGSIPVASQKALGLEVMKILKFDFDAGRLDVSKHPFCGGVADDVRITTRYSEEPADAFQSLMGIIHETGHARYEQNLPAEWGTQLAGKARSMGIHESQSLFMEMQLSRGPAFVSLIQPLVEKHLLNATTSKETLSVDNLRRLYTEVKPGFIRVDADELTYPMHVVLRYEIEHDLINGSVQPEDVPALWNAKMKEYLGIDTEGNFKDGCMQDIHWPSGYFGYFPTYTLGAMYAAQFAATIRGMHKDFDQRVSSGDLEFIFEWLRENVWSKGCLLSTNDIVKKATGETLNAAHYRKHLEQRYEHGLQ